MASHHAAARRGTGRAQTRCLLLQGLNTAAACLPLLGGRLVGLWANASSAQGHRQRHARTGRAPCHQHLERLHGEAARDAIRPRGEPRTLHGHSCELMSAASRPCRLQHGHPHLAQVPLDRRGERDEFRCFPAASPFAEAACVDRPIRLHYATRAPADRERNAGEAAARVATGRDAEDRRLDLRKTAAWSGARRM